MFEPGNLDIQISTSGLTVEEVLIDADANRFHEPLATKSSSIGVVKILSSIVAIGLLLLGVRLFYLQIGQGNNYLLAAQGNSVRTIQKFAPRGLILDRYGEIIVRNAPSFELVAIPRDLPTDEKKLNELLGSVASSVNMTAEEIKVMLKEVDREL